MDESSWQMPTRWAALFWANRELWHQNPLRSEQLLWLSLSWCEFEALILDETEWPPLSALLPSTHAWCRLLLIVWVFFPFPAFFTLIFWQAARFDDNATDKMACVQVRDWKVNLVSRISSSKSQISPLSKFLQAPHFLEDIQALKLDSYRPQKAEQKKRCRQILRVRTRKGGNRNR